MSDIYDNVRARDGLFKKSPERTYGYHPSEKGTHLVILISLDIDGTLEVGDPPGVLTMDMVRRARERGFLIGSCSDRPISAQRAIWGEHNIAIDFAVGKLMLPDVKAQFEADVYCHIGDREDLDKKYALEAGFEFLWPHEAIMQPWFLTSRGYSGPSGI